MVSTLLMVFVSALQYRFNSSGRDTTGNSTDLAVMGMVPPWITGQIW